MTNNFQRFISDSFQFDICSYALNQVGTTSIPDSRVNIVPCVSARPATPGITTCDNKEDCEISNIRFTDGIKASSISTRAHPFRSSRSGYRSLPSSLWYGQTM